MRYAVVVMFLNKPYYLFRAGNKYNAVWSRIQTYGHDKAITTPKN